ncbi:MAG: helicase-related protein, partial [Chthoniobacterales bacterium]
NYKLGIVFCNTQRMVDELADTLTAQGISADRLHGGIAQAQRTRVMNKFKKSEFEILVATDVAGRGIDVDDLEVVFNYDLPYDAEDYVHRIGRTGRAGKKGMAVTFVSGREIHKLQFIERYTKTKIHRGKLPTADEIDARRADALINSVRTTLEGEAYKAQESFVERLLEEGFNSTDIAAAVLHLLTSGDVPRDTGDRPTPAPEEQPRFQRERSEPSRDRREQRPERRDDRREPTQDRRPEAPRFDRAERPERPLPPRREDREIRDRKVETRKSDRGMQWISLSLGRNDRINPREIVTLIEDFSGQPGAAVGAIDITDHETLAQVPPHYVELLSRAASKLSWRGHQIFMKPAEARSGFTSRDTSFKPKTKKKW